MNTQLLREVKDAILKEAEKFDMWNFNPDDSCGTVGCIAGFVNYLEGNPMCTQETQSGETYTCYSLRIVRYAAERLGLTSAQTDHLFFGVLDGGRGFRPLQNTRYGTKEHAQAAADFIEAFIAQEEAKGQA